MSYLDRMKTLASRSNASLGVMASASPSDFALLLACAGCTFAPGETYSEREVNERLRAWLAGTGSMLSTDHVELRRWLVDNGVLSRDGFGRAYALGSPRDEIASAMHELAGHDVASLVRDAREQDMARRAERKARWQSGKHESRG